MPINAQQASTHAPRADADRPATPVPAAEKHRQTTVVLMGFDPLVTDELVTKPPPGARVVPSSGEDALGDALSAGALQALCLGPSLPPAATRALIDRVIEADPDDRVKIIALGAGHDLTPFGDLIDADRLFYLASGAPRTAEIRAILGEALADGANDRPPRTVIPSRSVETILQFLATVEDETEEARISRLCAQTVETLVGADAAECFLHDATDTSLASWPPGTAEERRESAAAGLVGWVARTGTAMRLDRVGADPRFEPEADAAYGSPRQRFLAVAVHGIGTPPTLPSRAVLVARRDPDAPPFSDGDEAALSLLAEHLTSALGRVALRWSLEGRTTTNGADPEGDPLFRQEALASHAAAGGTEARPLALAPGWIRRVYPLLLAGFVVSLAFLLVGSVHQYAAGVAVVRVGDRTGVPATAAGIVEEVPVALGQRVAAGDPLVRLDAASERAELARARGQFELALVERLRDPSHRAGQGTVGALREQLRLAEAHLAERTVRAPAAGVVVERRVEPGQPITPGQTVITLSPTATSGTTEPSLLAFFPGRYRTLLEAGLPLRLELDGHPGLHLRAEIEAVGDSVVGPSEARRIAGPEIADALPLAGPTVVVRARLDAPAFAGDGRTYRYDDGLVGHVEVEVRDESLLTTLVPGLRGLLGETDD